MAKLFTLYIDDAGIKLLIVKNEQVVKWAEIPLESGLVSGGVVQDKGKVAAILREQLKVLKIKDKRVIVGLSGLGSLYRIITLPEAPDAIFPEAVRHEVERIIPVPLDESYLSFQRIPKIGPEARVFIALYPKNVINCGIETLQKAGLEPYLADLAPLALARVVNASKIMLVKVRSINVDIVVLADKVPQVIRSIQLPGETETIQDRVISIVEEIERTAAFYNSGQPDAPSDTKMPLLVCGDLAESTEYQRAISTKIGYDIATMPSPLVSLSPDFVASRFMINIGLALKEISRQKKFLENSLINLNMLPAKYQVKHLSPLNVLGPVVIVITLGTIVVLTGLFLNARTQTYLLNQELESVMTAISEAQKEPPLIQEQIAELSDQIKMVESKYQSLTTQLQSMESNRSAAIGDTKAINSLLPPTVIFNNVIIDKNTITVSGFASNRDDVYSYASMLRESGRFIAVTVSSIHIRIEQNDESTEPTSPEVTFDLLLKRSG